MRGGDAMAQLLGGLVLAVSRIILQAAGLGLAQDGRGSACLPCPALPCPARRDGPATTSVCSVTHHNTHPPASVAHPYCTALHASDYATSIAALRLAICPLASRSSPLQKRVASRHLPQRKFAHAPVGRALLPLPASTAILARGTWKAKLAGPRSKHTTYPLTPTHNTPWCTSSLAQPPLSFLCTP